MSAATLLGPNLVYQYLHIQCFTDAQNNLTKLGILSVLVNRSQKFQKSDRKQSVVKKICQIQENMSELCQASFGKASETFSKSTVCLDTIILNHRENV